MALDCCKIGQLELPADVSGAFAELCGASMKVGQALVNVSGESTGDERWTRRGDTLPPPSRQRLPAGLHTGGLTLLLGMLEPQTFASEDGRRWRRSQWRLGLGTSSLLSVSLLDAKFGLHELGRRAG